jgi:hypothetical protein
VLSRCVAQIVARDNRHRTGCAAGADPLTLDTAVSGCARTQQAGPTTGPHAPHRSRSARSSNDCARVVASRAARQPSLPAVERSEDHRRARSSDQTSYHLRATPWEGAALRWRTRSAPRRRSKRCLGSCRVTRRPCRPAVERPEGHRLVRRPGPWAASVEPPLLRGAAFRRPARPDPRRRWLRAHRPVSDHSRALALRRPVTGRPPFDEELRPASRHLRAASGAALGRQTRLGLPRRGHRTLRLAPDHPPTFARRRSMTVRSPSGEELRTAGCHLRAAL